jgi:hypothetical protein
MVRASPLSLNRHLADFERQSRHRTSVGRESPSYTAFGKFAFKRRSDLVTHGRQKTRGWAHTPGMVPCWMPSSEAISEPNLECDRPEDR